MPLDATSGIVVDEKIAVLIRWCRSIGAETLYSCQGDQRTAAYVMFATTGALDVFYTGSQRLLTGCPSALNAVTGHDSDAKWRYEVHRTEDGSQLRGVVYFPSAHLQILRGQLVFAART